MKKKEFKGAIGNSDILSKLDLDPQADLNINYNLLSSTINKANSLHIPEKIQKKNNKRKHKKEPWMINDLLDLINKKNDMYRNRKSTINDEEYGNKKGNFKTYYRIVSDGIQNANHQYYFNTFTSHKNNMKKTWKTIYEILNIGKK